MWEYIIYISALYPHRWFGTFCIVARVPDPSAVMSTESVSSSTISATATTGGCHLLKITGYSQSKMLGEGVAVRSSEFEAGGYRWCILYCPRSRHHLSCPQAHYQGRQPPSYHKTPAYSDPAPRQAAGACSDVCYQWPEDLQVYGRSLGLCIHHKARARELGVSRRRLLLRPVRCAGHKHISSGRSGRAGA